ncbi:MAG: hypothetical protein BGN84_08260 [Afipia sp. 62-7]|nr:hypothetical protein [Afipia sp.]OJU15277.1 MAG: hypothetical protein BGN84_08260 [Afipia sp. 62-7]
MIIRFIAFALTLLLMTPGSVLSVMADPVGGASEPKPRAKAAAPRDGQAKARRAAAQQQAADRARRCAEAVSNAQGAEVGTSVLSSAVGFLPFGSAASSVAANIGTTVASEAIRQKAAADVQGRCGG